MIEQVKSLRVQIDGLAQLTKELKPIQAGEYDWSILYPKNTKEIEKSVDSLLLAKAWLGKVLQELGESTPYANDGNRKTVDDIEPTADKFTEGFREFVLDGITISSPEHSDFLLMTHIEKVDFLRQEIKHIIHLVEQTIFTSNQSREFAIARTNSYNHLCEARFWLGFELEKIKNNK